MFYLTSSFFCCEYYVLADNFWLCHSRSSNFDHHKTLIITKRYFFPKIAKGAASLGGRIFPRTTKFATTSSTSSCPKWCSVGLKTCSRSILDNVSACTGGLDGLRSNAAWRQQYRIYVCRSHVTAEIEILRRCPSAACRGTSLIERFHGGAPIAIQCQ